MAQDQFGYDLYEPDLNEASEYERNYREAMARGKSLGYEGDVGWAPQDGSQTHFLDCPFKEVLMHGPRGTGKSDVMLFAFAQSVGLGFGGAWRGVIFRQTYPQLGDLVAKSERWFYQIWPEAKFNRAEHVWRWPTGEQLLFRHIAKPDDYWKYHGSELPFIGFEELTTWASPEYYTPMFSCCRSSVEGMPRMIRANTNPYGAGHTWVQDRFKLHSEWWKTKVLKVGDEYRAAIYSHLAENKKLLKADPNYPATVAAAAHNKSMLLAWQVGNWEIVAGGMFSDVFDNRLNIVPEFEIPDGWYIDRSFDWGSSKPFSVCWWARSPGGPVGLKSGGTLNTVRGDLFLFREWYGWNGKPNTGLRMTAREVSAGIVDRQLEWGIHHRVKPGPADASIFDVQNGTSIANDMAQPVRVQGRMRPGVQWFPSDKRAGSRIQGWELMRSLFKNAHPGELGYRESPGLFVMENHCPQFLRTVPSIPRDDLKIDDISTDAEDHVCFSGDTLIRTDSGAREIARLRSDDKVQCIDGSYLEYQDLRMYAENADTVRVNFKDGSHVVCTPDHKFLTIGGWLSAEDLSGLYVVADGSYIGVDSIEPDKSQDVYCITVPSIGHFALANGTIARNCDASRYKIWSGDRVARRGRTSGGF